MLNSMMVTGTSHLMPALCGLEGTQAALVLPARLASQVLVAAVDYLWSVVRAYRESHQPQV